MSEAYFPQPDLPTPPTARAAYSDRTAWIMAQMSLLSAANYGTDAFVTQYD